MNLQPNLNLDTSISVSRNCLPVAGITRFHTKRLREVYRSAGWPFLDTVEIELIAAGLLERTFEPSGYDKVRVAAYGIAYLAQSIQKNRQNRSPHELLVLIDKAKPQEDNESLVNHCFFSETINACAVIFHGSIEAR